MTEINMRALRSHPFGTGTREEGEEYVASASEAKVLEGLGWAKRSDGGKKSEAALKPAKPVADKHAKKPAKKVAKGTYRTRNMKAGK